MHCRCQNTKSKTSFYANTGKSNALFFKDGNIKLFKFDYEIVKINNEIRQINRNSHINVLSNEDRMVLDNALSMTNVQSLIIQNTLLILQKDIDSLAKSIYCMDIAQQYAWVMFEIVAKELLELCAKDNVNAIAFIEFYNGGSIELRGKIFKKPLITDNNGNPWTIPLITKESSYQELLESKNKELRMLVDKKASKVYIEAITNEINTLILNKSNMLTHIENTQKNLAALGKEQIKLLEMQERLREQISYALKKNREYFVQYDLLSRALADAIANAKELI